MKAKAAVAVVMVDFRGSFVNVGFGELIVMGCKIFV
jgi:hypothetical protein